MQKKALRSSLDKFLRRRDEQLRASRLKQQQGMRQTKQELADSKAFEGLNVKELSRKNNERVSEIRQNILRENKKKS